MFAPITKVYKGESNTHCPSTLKVTYSSVEKLSKALDSPHCNKILANYDHCHKSELLGLNLWSTSWEDDQDWQPSGRRFGWWELAYTISYMETINISEGQPTLSLNQK
jgi:hypothetical protein